MDAMREEERVCMAHNAIIIFSDENMIQEEGKYHPNQWRHLINHTHFRLNTSLIMNKHPWKKTHKGPFTSKQKTLERINRLHNKCGFLDNEHLFMLTKTWLEYLQYEEVDVEILENLYNANCTPKSYFVGKDFESWDPKSTVLVIIFVVFMWLLSLINSVPIIIVHLQLL